MIHRNPQQVLGFVLTRHWRDTPGGVQLDFWVKTDDTAHLVTINGQESVAFITESQLLTARKVLALGPSPGRDVIREKPLALTDFKGEPVYALYFKSQRTMLNVKSQLEDKGVALLEGDVRPAERFLMERFITGGVAICPTADSAVINYSQSKAADFVNPQLKQADYWPRLRVVSLDIETSFDGRHLFSIGLFADGNLRVVMLVRHQAHDKAPQVSAKGQTGDPDIVWYPNEKELLLAFNRWVAEYDPDIFIGWNLVNFDFRFLQKKYEQHRVPAAIGRHQLAVDWRKANTDSEHYFITIPGRVVLDGIDTLKAATYNFESFSLEFVSRQLLDRGKLIDHVDNRGEEIMRLYYDDPSALARYNLEDCRLVWEIFEKAHLMHFAIERARLTGLPLDKTGGSVAAFENLYLPRLHRRGYVAPNVGMMQSDIQAPGGYVMDSIPGLYQHVLVLDFKSLYPSIIRTFRIDPLSLIHSQLNAQDFEPDDPQVHGFDDTPTGYASSDWVPGFNGALFSKQQHLLPQIIEDLWQARDEAKARGDKALSQAIKIIMNSFYGVLGTPLCRFYDPKLSSSITLRGHDILQQTRTLIEAQGYQVIYGDTDSVFVWLKGAYSLTEADAIGEHLAELLNGWWQNALAVRYGITSYLEIEYETHYRQFHMPKVRGSDAGSKKRYAGLIGVDDNEQLVFKGLENVRTDWTHLARDVQYQVYWRVFHNEPVNSYLKDIVRKVKAGESDQQLFYRKRLRRPLADYQKNIPPHVQAARKADAFLTSQSREPQYQRGGWVEYLITVNGPEPREQVISAIDYDHYLERQLAPAVDGLLAELGTSLSEILNQQMSLF
ncbi:MAG: DNA polymerase II [Pseudomonadales bacterium]|nr:DNA polymerase II [Pseudomonadales bacterium]